MTTSINLKTFIYISEILKKLYKNSFDKTNSIKVKMKLWAKLGACSLFEFCFTMID